MSKDFKVIKNLDVEYFPEEAVRHILVTVDKENGLKKGDKVPFFLFENCEVADIFHDEQMNCVRYILTAGDK